jgi:hypothetical protein
MKYIIIIILWFCGTLVFAQAPDIYKLVYDSMELVTGGVSTTKTLSIKKNQDYKVILLEVPTGHNGYDVVISFKPKVVVDPTPILIDNIPGATIANQLVNTYVPGSPTWTHAVVQGHWSNTISFSNVANSSLTTKFTGTKIEGYFERKSTHGKAMISIDGGAETEINLNNPTELKQQKVFESTILPRGLHTVKIRVVGGGFVVFDYWKVTP